MIKCFLYQNDLYICLSNITFMNTIDLNQVIKNANLKPTHLAKELFPGHKHPYSALNYIRQGKGLLNSWQIAKLSELANVPIEALFTKA